MRFLFQVFKTIRLLQHIYELLDNDAEYVGCEAMFITFPVRYALLLKGDKRAHPIRGVYFYFCHFVSGAQIPPQCVPYVPLRFLRAVRNQTAVSRQRP